MAVLTWPSVATPDEFTLARYTKVFRAISVFGKSGQNVDTLNDRWKISCSIGIRSNFDGAALETFVNSLRSGASIVRCHHFGRPEIRGVLTNPTTANIVKGAQSLSINCTAGNYLKAGDMLGIGDQLFQVAFDCSTYSSLLVVPITMRNRLDLPEGLTVVTSQPTGKFRAVPGASTSFGPGGVMMGTTLELVEAVN